MSRIPKFLIFLALVLIGGMALYRWEPINRRLSWQVDVVRTYWRGIIYPANAMPAPLPFTPQATALPPAPSPSPRPATAFTPTVTPRPATPLPSSTPLPENVNLPAPDWEKQDWNNCGPATLTMYLRFYGWQGDQFDISRLVKPAREDRNVNPEELAFYVRTQAGWMNAIYRVGGDLETLQRLLAAGYPVMVEESFTFDEPYWPKDDLWAAHYLLLTGYNQVSRTFTAQDSFHGADQVVSFENLQAKWHPFNNLYFVVYPVQDEAEVQALLGDAWEEDAARQHALEVARAQTEANPEDAFAWFNLGSNLVYFENYEAAAQAYDRARTLGLPQRMLRYQFSPFFAYFHSGRIEDLLALTTYALQRTPNSEEALLWYGWGLYRQGNTTQAIAHFRAALDANPTSQDARYALDFVGASP